MKNEYKTLPVKGKTVIDIGSNIGGSLIYFALRDAYKIIGFEPYPKSHNLSIKNITINGFSDKITAVLAGCSGKSGYLTIDPNFESDAGSQLHEFQNGIQVPLLTLLDIVKKFDVPQDSALKIDCEGYEYDIILSTPSEVLGKFSHILIEYHYGYKNLKKKLENCGFRVSTTTPWATTSLLSIITNMLRKILVKNSQKIKKNRVRTKRNCDHIKNNIGYVGLIYAIRNS